ncbi:PREDICTED: cytochrome b561 and DOMON domain-containing protein At3g61750 isoform X1 [Camelina sativa]|uniref:Cytochrome b561 and DOMON domain-containing protein At3g61750 isoform X1 n=1 Tax=Camelina sativa TaxID=90675 RepID=A0ABM0SMC3_CAMSA|nr:PREDICTED: cytochrome b561 and DOMON domain-containing protein At3g61750 isoform X1 [Camelina sativa]
MRAFVGFYILCILIGQDLPFLAADDVNAINDSTQNLCFANRLSDFLPPPYSNISDNMPCTPLWNTFVLRYSESRDNVMTIIVSALYTTGWVGIGFSKDGRMVGSSAMIGWISKKGHAKIKQYYLQGTERDQVVPDQGELQLQKVPPVVALHGAMIYLAFQVKFAVRVPRRAVILAFSTAYPSKLGRLTKHDDKTTVVVDFSKAASGATSIKTTTSTEKTKHGVMAILGWGFLLPVGAILARYLRHKDPLWYYLHICLQFTGFIFGLAAVILGIQLYNRIHPNIPAHRGIGIFLLVLSILQVLAFFARPQKETKMRRYWNWYHHWIGRISLFFGAVNIVLGIRMANNGGDGWKIGYGFVLSLTLLAFVVLEIFRIRGSIGSPSSHTPPSFEAHPTSSTSV